MASADFSQFAVTTDRAPPVRPHGISPSGLSPEVRDMPVIPRNAVNDQKFTAFLTSDDIPWSAYSRYE